MMHDIKQGITYCSTGLMHAVCVMLLVFCLEHSNRKGPHSTWIGSKVT